MWSKEEINKSTETDAKLIQMLELESKDIKTIIITVSHIFKKLET